MNHLLIAPTLEFAKDVGTRLIDRIFPDKEKQAAERAEAQLALTKLQGDQSLAKGAQQLSAIIEEARSEDPWTSRARPSFLYVMYVIILWSIPFGLLYAWRPEVAEAMAKGAGLWLQAIPEALWTLFGVGYTGYTVMRGAVQWKNSGK